MSINAANCYMEHYLLSCLYLLLFSNVIAEVTINDGGVHLMGELCPGAMSLECEGADLTFLQWRYTSTDSSEFTTIVTYTSTDEVDETTQLSASPAFISAQLTSISVNKQQVQFANFSSFLTVDVSQLNKQSITEIQCGNAVSFAVEKVNITIIEESLPEAPVITSISVTYQDSKLEMIEISWEKISVQCVIFESLLYYEATLSEAVPGQQRIINRVSSDVCSNDCSTTFVLPERNLSLAYQIALSAINSVGIRSSIPPSPIDNQSSEYISLNITFMDCVTTVQCSSFIDGSCTLEYTSTIGSSSGSGQLVSGSNATLLLSPNTTYIFTATVLSLVNNIPTVIEMMNFTTGAGNPRLSTINIILISVGVLLFILSLVFWSVIFGFTLKLYGTSMLASGKWKISLTICFIMVGILVLVCAVLWIAIGCIVGLENNTCRREWQQFRDILIICALVINLLTSVVGCVLMIVTCYYCHKAHKSYVIEQEKLKQKEQESVSLLLRIRNILPSFPFSKSSKPDDPSKDISMTPLNKPKEQAHKDEKPKSECVVQ